MGACASGSGPTAAPTDHASGGFRRPARRLRESRRHDDGARLLRRQSPRSSRRGPRGGQRPERWGVPRRHHHPARTAGGDGETGGGIRSRDQRLGVLHPRRDAAGHHHRDAGWGRGDQPIRRQQLRRLPPEGRAQVGLRLRAGSRMRATPDW